MPRMIDELAGRMLETACHNLEEDGHVMPILFCLRGLDANLPMVLGLKVEEEGEYQPVLRDAVKFARDTMGMTVLVAVSESWIVTTAKEGRNLSPEVIERKYAGKVKDHPDRQTCVIATGADGTRAVMQAAVYDETVAGFVKVDSFGGSTDDEEGAGRPTGAIVDILLGRE